jgi:hypothetical protein
MIMVPPRHAAGYQNRKAPWNGALRWRAGVVWRDPHDGEPSCYGLLRSGRSPRERGFGWLVRWAMLPVGAQRVMGRSWPGTVSLRPYGPFSYWELL